MKNLASLFMFRTLVVKSVTARLGFDFSGDLDQFASWKLD